MVLSFGTSGTEHFIEAGRRAKGAGDMAIRHVLAIGLPTAPRRPGGNDHMNFDFVAEHEQMRDAAPRPQSRRGEP
jgi:hypothetical protein